ncbi:hypothetical protein, partial [Pseudoalteromonas distincta]|uniref:hypothetical protein n=1 Tax=Pseudoalteromonas distincta TaxID=77608 RepID=UPI0034E87D2B
AFLKAGKLDEAEATLRKTIKFEEHYLGYGHPLLALSLNNLVVVLLSKGVLNKIEATLNQAEYILNRAYGPDSTYTSVTATNHGHY